MKFCDNIRLIIMQGVSGSGKSTWAKQYASDNGFIIISRDQIRKELLGKDGLEAYFNTCGSEYSIEEEVTKIEHNELAKHLIAGEKVIIDDTNLRMKYISAFVRLAFKCGVDKSKIVIHRVDVASADEAFHRVKSRGERIVSKEVIESQIASLSGCRWGIDDVYVEVEPERKPYFPPFPVEKYVANQGCPKAIIVDIDGTLAHRTIIYEPYPHYRSFYAYQDCSTDAADPLVKTMVKNFSQDGYKIIFVTGRKKECEKETRQFLNRELPELSYELIMRDPEVDFHNGKDDSDDIVKYRLFNEYIRDKYNVIGVIDDRKRVLAMWEALGIKTVNMGKLNENF